MFVNILHDTDKKRCFKNAETMNVYFMLYAKSVDKELIESWNGTSITLPTGQTVASKHYISEVFECSLDKAKNYLKSLKNNRLISVRYNTEIQQNVITVNAVNPTPGSKYVQMQIPDGIEVAHIYQNRCRYLTNIYMYLTLHAMDRCVKSLITKSDIERGELVESLHAIARKCGCCAATVRNVFDSLKTLGLLAFEAIKNVAMKVKLMFYPALKEAAKKVTKAIQTFVKKDTKNDNVTDSKKVAEPSVSNKSYDSIKKKLEKTPVTEDVAYILVGKKHNNDISRLNNIILEVNREVGAMKFPLSQLRTALETLYEENKKAGDDKITATIIIDFLKEYKRKAERIDNEKRILNEDLQKRYAVIDNMKTKLASLDETWKLAAKAEEEIKKDGQLSSFNEDEINKVFYLFQPANIFINKHSMMEGQAFFNIKERLIEKDEKVRPESWGDSSIAKAVLLERFLGNTDVTVQHLRVACLQDRKKLEQDIERQIRSYNDKKRDGEMMINTMFLG